MSRVLSTSPPLAGQHELVRAIRSLPASAVTALVAVAALCALFVAVKPALGSAVRMEGPANSLAVAAQGEAPARARFRCESCGVVESMNHMQAAGDQPASYEFTVRLRDGSSRVSSVASAGKWHIGDHIMLIGGPAPRQ
jgi:hypothetical protein